MGPLASRGVFLLVCIGLLALQPEQVSGLRSIDLALKWGEGQSPFLKHLRVLAVVAEEEDVHMKLSLAPAPSIMFDPNQSNKRSVRKGSDPIHNRG
ncbi:CLAVATA3/ESR (CLE)-related protein 45 [Alnus glutinosa]|uniref:CLAVATA3/ESR (CLE)-related protein 45 n=1 Tax=Alnus glutinosa TaxID=3517 RepID=UPI002D7873EC|nr:CLAVATA3/ESR (CLE)-related protein 45 [Alnus glutinosa]